MFAIIKGQGRDRVNFLWENFFAVIRDHGCVSSRDDDRDLAISTDLFLRDFDLLFEALRLLAAGGKETDGRSGGGGGGGGGGNGVGPTAGGGIGALGGASTRSSTPSSNPSGASVRKLKAYAALGAFGGVSDVADEGASRDWVGLELVVVSNVEKRELCLSQI